jgi:hypothetical protein
MIHDEVEKPDIYYFSRKPADIISVTELYPEPNKSFLQTEKLFLLDLF